VSSGCEIQQFCSWDAPGLNFRAHEQRSGAFWLTLTPVCLHWCVCVRCLLSSIYQNLVHQLLVILMNSEQSQRHTADTIAFLVYFD